MTLAAFNRSFGWRLSDDELDAFNAGDSVAIETDDGVVYVEFAAEESDPVATLITIGMTREEATTWALLGVAA